MRKFLEKILTTDYPPEARLARLVSDSSERAFGGRLQSTAKKKTVDGSRWTVDQTAFTLIELIIYMTLLSMFLLILTNVFIAILRVRTESQASSSAEQDGRFILSRLAYDINRATVTAVPNATTLTLTIGGQTYTYTINNSKLQLTQPAGTDFLNGSGSTVSNLTFQRLVNPGGLEDTIRVQFNVVSETKRGSSNEIRSFSTTIGRRIR